MPVFVAPAAAGFFSTAAGAFIGKALLSVGLSVLSSKLFAPKVPDGAGLTGIQVTANSALEYRRICYGQAILSGPLNYDNLSGSDNEYLWWQIPLTDHEVDSFVSIWFDNDEIPVADIDWTAGTGASDGTGTGDVSTAEFIGANSQKAVNLWYYLGHADQPVAGALDTEFTEITSTHRLREVSHFVARLLYNEDTQEVWEGGNPQDMKAVIKGRRVYDSRLDDTNGGSGAHRFATPSTWEWSDNPALCLVDYLTQYMGVTFARVDWASFASAADDCDVLVDIPPVSSPQNTETRFTCNGILSLGENHKDNLDAILSSFAANLRYSGGQWAVRASVWEASSVTFDSSDMAGDIVTRGAAPEKDRFNGVDGFFIDPVRDYEAVEFPRVASSAYVTRDNGKELQYSLELPMTNSETMGQRLAFRLLEQGNNQQVYDLPMNVRGLKAAINDTITVDIPERGWSDGGNELLHSEDASDAAWTKSNVTVTANDITGPFGRVTADKIEAIATSAASMSQVASSIGDASGMVFAIWVRRGSGDLDANSFGIRNETSATNLSFIDVDYSDGTFTRTVGSQQVIINNLQNGWMRVVMFAKAGISNGDDIRCYQAFAGGAAATAGDYVHTLGAQLAAGTTEPFYVKTTTAAITTLPRTMRVIDWSRRNDGGYTVVGQEDDQGDYADPLVAEYGIVNESSATVPPNIVPAPTTLVATPVFGGINLTWVDPPSRLFDNIEVWVSDDNDRNNAELIATVPKSPFLDNITSLFRTRYYWIRAVGINGITSNYEPNTTTTTASGFPLVQQAPMVADPFVRGGAALWDVSGAGVSYQAAAGTDGTDAVRVTQSTVVRNFWAEERRGPRIFDVMASGKISIEVRWRWSLQNDPGGSWLMFAFANIKVSDEDGSNADQYVVAGNTSFQNGDTTGVWKDDSAVIEIDDTGTPPRFIQVGIQMGINAIGPSFDFDFIDASVSPKPFAGADSSGIVPDPMSEASTFLQDDGTWATPAGTGLQDVADDTSPTLGGDLAAGGNTVLMADSVLSRPEITDYGITHTTVALDSPATSATLNYANGQSFLLDLQSATGTVTLTFSNPPASGIYGEMVLEVVQGSTARLITWPASVDWPGGAAPVLSTGNDDVDLFHFSTRDGGTIWRGTFTQDFG